MPNNSENEIKKLGKVYTPPYIIARILDDSGYKGNNVLQKHVVDNSAGDGEFLLEFIRRYKKAFFKGKDKNNIQIQKEFALEIETYVHGIEINPDSIVIIKDRIKKMFINEFYFEIVPEIDIKQNDTLFEKSLDEKMDYVFGNPPYVRRKNLSDDDAYIAKENNMSGMVDLYLLFFIKGKKMLKPNGVLGYITPNSYFYTQSGERLRQIILTETTLLEIIDMGHNNPFKNADTYTAITIFKNTPMGKKIKLKYSDDFDKKSEKISISQEDIEKLTKYFYFSNDNNDNFLDIVTYENEDNSEEIKVKNGAASNADWFFYFDDAKGVYTQRAYKASTAKFTRAYFPYDDNGDVVKLNDIKEYNHDFFEKLKIDRPNLENRSLQKRNWYEFARSQGIKDFVDTKVFTLAINNLIKDKNDLKMKILPKKTVVYSGFYIQNKSKTFLNNIMKLLQTDDFSEYVKKLGKHKSGGYYTYSSVDVARFINYKLREGKNE
ncbi:HsdM family class I SAM-dependent methyltransferase [Mesoplasma lactucae]|uniref:site-specific DNA-methyltransferase (adenine-specific) n=1 Tax=Mesoplasma lactucae ATCC 49193 TaxID=81460 RepID=A0A291ISS5_9MOLU|nr:Eco57I restriction-modification methylase domain-containing protein [Mesoplasma lactucae]ATG97803.1 hypothetical protein CP520_03645 [Mesoplasma lactucae ATCC 49193]ATZ20419.1 hypothetical protein MLACT_v1c05980 [Mesoplasma lactucae ATCC 49193]MCL8216590.1 hypothetical protein [Mesoplasma lactucae ATCC 49193]